MDEGRWGGGGFGADAATVDRERYIELELLARALGDRGKVRT